MPNTVIASYRVRSGELDAFMRLVEQHHPTLTKLARIIHERTLQ